MAFAGGGDTAFGMSGTSRHWRMAGVGAVAVAIVAAVRPAPAAAQTARDSLEACRAPGPPVRGVVRRINGALVRDVPVTVAWSAIVILPRRITHVPCVLGTTADSAGRFRFDDVRPAGPVVLRVDGAQGELGLAYRQEFRLDRGDSIIVWMPTVGARPASAAGTVPCRTVGRIVRDDGSPVARAAVRLAPMPPVRTDDRGDFSLAACPSGEVMRLEVMGLPIAPFSAQVLVPNHPPALVVTVDRMLPRLDPVLVEGDRRLADWQGFDDRRERALGTFITRDQIRRRDVPTLSRLFETMPGVRVGDDGLLYVTRNSFERCSAAVYLDGIRLDGMRLDAITVPDVLGIEVYRGAADTPPQFTRLGTAGCGTVVIWSRIAPDANRPPR